LRKRAPRKNELYAARKQSFRPPSISRFAKLEQANSLLLLKTLSAVLKHLSKLADSALEDIPHVVKSEAVPCVYNRLFNCVIRVKLPILRDLLEHAQGPQVTRACIWQIGWIESATQSTLASDVESTCSPSSNRESHHEAASTELHWRFNGDRPQFQR
jgi:hypothetical protein